MSRPALILYGPPASGKDTVTAALHDLDPRYELYPRLKRGDGKREGYRMTSAEHLAGLRAAGELLYLNERYGNVYGVDSPHLVRMLQRAAIPVLHLGQTAAVRAVHRFPARWVAVALWCSRASTEERARARGSTDVAARLAAWDQTAVDLATAEEGLFTTRISTDSTSARDAASHIDAQVRSMAEGVV